ncbi:MAG: Transcriptional regulatory protein BtsR [Pseudomonadota bacterium]|jgi:DNA-binding LytR/AlgR family response regulator
MNPTAIIADDEPLLRERLAGMLHSLWPELQIVGQARNGREAVELVDLHKPAIAFLDIRMPVMTGLEAARAIGADAHVVFVTAFEEYAVKAFEAGALDYVVKPYDAARLALAVARVRERVAQPAREMDALLRDLSVRLAAPKPVYLQWIRASVGQSVRLAAVADVLFFQSDEKYTRVVASQGELLIRKTIKELIDELDPQQFAQIHRATIVRLGAIARVERTGADFLDLHLQGSGDVLKVSRSYTHLFKQM